MSDQETRWKRDGWEASVRIGVLTPHADVGPESELKAMAPPGVAIHATRVPFGASLVLYRTYISLIQEYAALVAWPAEAA